MKEFTERERETTDNERESDKQRKRQGTETGKKKRQ